MSLRSFTNGYVEAALWSSTDDNGEPLDKSPELELSDESLEIMKADAKAFYDAYNLKWDDDAQAGHDFWLTRNRHGAGFWDGDYPEPQAKELTDAAHGFGEAELYVGDDGMIYHSHVSPAKRNPRQQSEAEWERTISTGNWFDSGVSAGLSSRYSSAGQAWESRKSHQGAPAEYSRRARESFIQGFELGRSKRERNPSGHRIAITYETVTPESAEQGDVDDRGWIDQDGEDMDETAEDFYDGDVVKATIKGLRDNGVSEPSSSHFHPGVWYTAYEYNRDYRTGAVENRSFHLKGYTEDEERRVFEGLFGRKGQRNPGYGVRRRFLDDGGEDIIPRVGRPWSRGEAERHIQDWQKSPYFTDRVAMSVEEFEGSPDAGEGQRNPDGKVFSLWGYNRHTGYWGKLTESRSLEDLKTWQRKYVEGEKYSMSAITSSGTVPNNRRPPLPPSPAESLYQEKMAKWMKYMRKYNLMEHDRQSNPVIQVAGGAVDFTDLGDGHYSIMADATHPYLKRGGRMQSLRDMAGTQMGMPIHRKKTFAEQPSGEWLEVGRESNPKSSSPHPLHSTAIRLGFAYNGPGITTRAGEMGDVYRYEYSRDDGYKLTLGHSENGVGRFSRPGGDKYFWDVRTPMGRVWHFGITSHIPTEQLKRRLKSIFTAKKYRNPEPAAADLYESFHGKPSEEVLEIGETIHYHEHLAGLGVLKEVKVDCFSNYSATINFDEETQLCSNEEGTQLYIVGGDQSLDLAALKFSPDEIEKEQVAIGIITEITYHTQKSFHKFKPTDYYHELGEESGHQPILTYDTRNQLLTIAGGAYKIKPEGITN